MGTDNLEMAKEICGNEAFEYLKNKHRGGRAGGDGVLFETWYAIYNIAVLVKRLILEKNENSLPILTTQTLDFVDDFTINWGKGLRRQHFQLKNSAGASWNSGKHPVAEDFRLQRRLNDGLGVAATSTTLVTSDYKNAQNLSDSMPADISPYSSVDQFAFGETLNHTLQVESRLQDALASLCVSADLDKLEKLGTLLIGAWVAKSGSPCSLDELWEGVLQHDPSYVRFTPTVDILKEFNRILMQIGGFTYTIDKGFFEWSFLGLDSGILGYPVSSEKFDEFQNVIVKEEPSTFEDLERHLI